MTLGGGCVLHMEVLLRRRRLLCSLGAIWFCAKASLRGRRPLCSLVAMYLGMVGTESNKYQVEFDPRGRELVSSCEKIKVLHKIIINLH